MMLRTKNVIKTETEQGVWKEVGNVQISYGASRGGGKEWPNCHITFIVTEKV